MSSSNSSTLLASSKTFYEHLSTRYKTFECTYEGTPATDLCQDFVTTFVRCAAGVIAYAKPAALFSFTFRKSCKSCSHTQCSDASLRSFLKGVSRELSLFGVRLLATSSTTSGKVSFIAYRPQLIENLLLEASHQRFLSSFGYPTHSADDLMRSFRSRISAFYLQKKSFPHEIGLALGYPLTDVQGFMRGDREVFTSVWKVYDNSKDTLDQLASLMREEDDCKNRFFSGETLAELLITYNKKHGQLVDV